MQLYGAPAGVVKKFELRWFHSQALCDTSSLANERRSRALAHRMPFLHRTLSFSPKTKVSAGNDLSAVYVSSDLPCASKIDIKLDVEHVGELHSPAKLQKKPDLLYKIFKHRVERYNDALLSSPRRATRASSASSHSESNDNSGVSSEAEGDHEMAADHRRRTLTLPVNKDLHACLDMSLSSEAATTPQKEVTERKKRKLSCDPASSKSPAMSPLSSIDEGAAAMATKSYSSMLPPSKRRICYSSEEGPVAFSAAPETKLFLYYLFLDTDNVPACQVEVQENSRRCPFCFIDLVSSDCRRHPVSSVLRF